MDGRAPPGATTYRELLATRVLSVDAYWQELRDLRGRPARDREIPVPLWPGESVQQYDREFARWLSARRLSLSDMRDDPVAERNYRLQYAQTRVTRPIESQRPPPRSRSRSPSRPMSPPRRFAGEQQRQHQRYNPPTRREHDSRVSSLEKRPSPDNRRPFATQQPWDRRRQDRSYSRERPQQLRHTAVPEAPRTYAPRGAEPRPRQDPRVPPPRDAQRQHAADGQHWSKSPSRSPQYGRAASPSRSDRSSSSQVHRSASPHPSFGQGRANPETLRRQLLARRVISVDAFRDEMYKLRNGFIREDDLKRPHEAMVRIPVILWPGETMVQYTQKFERWLESRSISLPSLRDNPARERSLWHSFAYTRAGTSALGGEPARLKARSRSPLRRRSRSPSRSRSSSRSVRRSSERGRPAMPAGHHEKPRPIPAVPSDRPQFREPEHRRRSRSPPPSIAPPENPRMYTNKTRRQLLERRIISLDIFQKEVEQNTGVGDSKRADGNVLSAIPVPLMAGESMGLYDHRFWTWLEDYDETKDSLRDRPVRERRFRVAFAYLRAKRPQRSTAASDRSAGGQNSQDARPNTESLAMDVLKSARDRLVMNAKRHADEMERKTQAAREAPESKRARVAVEGGVSTHASANVSPNSQPGDHRLRGTSSSPSPLVSRYPPRSSFASTILAPSKLVPTSAPSTASFAGARSVGIQTPSQATPAAPSLAPARSACASSRAQTTPASIFDMLQSLHMAAPAQPTQRTFAMRPAPAPTQASTLRSHDTQVQAAHSAATAVSKSRTPSTPAAPHSSVPPVQTVVSTSQTAAGAAERADLYAGVYSSASAVRRTEGHPVGIYTVAESRMTALKPMNLPAAPHSVPMSWNERSPRSATASAAPNPVVSLSAAAPATATVASTPSRPPLRKIAPAKSAMTNANADIAPSTSDTADAAVLEPETTPVEAHEVSDAESNSVDDPEEHDGDVMNPDGCCCTKCMRNWAKTLTDRMDQLEKNVMALKNEVVRPGTVKSS